MTAKTMIKKAGIITLSAVILQDITPVNGITGIAVNAYASENTGTSYTVLDLYTYLQDTDLQNIHLQIRLNHFWKNMMIIFRFQRIRLYQMS